MTTYCTGCTKAKVTISNPPLVMGFDAPVDIEFATTEKTISCDMTQPISQFFPSLVTSVELFPQGQTYNNGAAVNPVRDCPIPAINGKTISSDFDNYYPDNSGSCSYKVSFSTLTINGMAFPSIDGIFTVACDDGCPPGQCKCHSDSYPGYCCNDCGSTSASIANIVQIVRNKGNG